MVVTNHHVKEMNTQVDIETCICTALAKNWTGMANLHQKQ